MDFSRLCVAQVMIRHTMMVAVAAAAGLFFPLSAAASESGPPAGADDLGSYPLDDLSRTIDATGKMRCPKVAMVKRVGDPIRYHKPVKVYAGFAARLAAFEAIVKQVGESVYGRAPRTIRHMGTYHCRRIRAYPTLLSEHGLGNGIDIAGFTFGPLPKSQAAPAGLPRALRRGFKVSVLKHWDKQRGTGAVHARFLRALIARLKARPDIFRVMLGPSFPGHKDHFHFDAAPYRLIAI